MDRYFIEPHDHTIGYVDHGNGYTSHRRRTVAYKLFDRSNTQEPLASAIEVDIAQRIVALLNADERSREKGTAK